MTYKVEPLTKDQINAAINSNSLHNVIQALSNLEEFSAFEVGSVLVAKSYYDDKLVTIDGVPEKYVVVHKHELGLVFVKRLLQTGQLSACTTCLNTSGLKYILDPKYVESMLLQDEESYDPKKDADDLKKKKDQVRRHNKKLKFKYDTSAEAYKILRSFKKGDKLWHSWSLIPHQVSEYEVTEVKEKDQFLDYYSHRKIKVPYVTVTPVKGSSGYTREIDEHSLKDIFKSKPMMVTE